MLETHINEYGTLPLISFSVRYDFAGGTLPKWIRSEKSMPICLHHHSELELIYITNGSMYVEINAEQDTIRKGDLMLISPYDLHRAEFVDKNEILEYRCLIFELSILSGCGTDAARMIDELRQGMRRFPIKMTGTPANEIGELMLKLENIQKAHLADANHTISDLRLAAGICEITAMILPHSYTIDSESSLDRVTFIRAVDTYIQIHMSENLTTAMISADFGFSKGYFCALFKRCFGTNFTEYLTIRRIRRAIDLCRSTGGSLVSIAKSVGFEDYAYFSRCFKKRTGMSPTGYFSADKNEV